MYQLNLNAYSSLSSRNNRNKNVEDLSNFSASSSSSPSPLPLKINPNNNISCSSLGLIYLILSSLCLLLMGAGLSSYGEYDSRAKCCSLSEVPEDCIACVLSYLDPVEVCKFARVNSSFHRASSADFVWESKLPSNYKFLVCKVLQEGLKGLSYKEGYARLCQPNRFDDGNKEVWMEKNSGGLCFAISAKALRITGIDDRRYWNHIPTEESRFQNMAYLQQIWWVEVDGELEFEFPAGQYSLFFRLQLGRTTKRLGRRVCNTDQVHGWDIRPVQFKLSTSDGQQALTQCHLNETGNWILHHAGDFFVTKSSAVLKIKFSLIQIDCTHTKGGLCLDSVLIYPSGMKEK